MKKQCILGGSPKDGDPVEQAVINSIPMAVILTDRFGKVRFANEMARCILAQGDGLSVASDGVITCDQHDLLRGYLGGAENSHGRSVQNVLPVGRPSGKRPFVLVVSPVRYSRSTFREDRPTVILLVSDPDSKLKGMEPALRSLYALTLAEARLAVILMHGESLSDACDHLRIRRTTARTHLSKLFEKLGVTRQAELVAVLNRSVAPMITGIRFAGSEQSSDELAINCE
jgi:DNA-binding CsgD family transcriptional regulator